MTTTAAILTPIYTSYHATRSSLRINDLPEDILRDIFAASITEHDSAAITTSLQGPRSTRGPSVPAFLFASVCKRWRDVAVDHKALWQHAVLSISDRPSSPWGLDRWRLCLERSAPLPVSISITGAAGGVDLREVKGIFDTHASRVRTLACTTLERSVLLDILEHIAYRIETSALEAITIQDIVGTTQGNTSDDWWTLLDKIRAPHLSQLAVVGDWVGYRDLSAPWESLTHITCDAWGSPSDIVSVLQHGRNLVHASFALTGNDYELLDKPPKPPITHAKLQSLNISVTHSPGALFERLHLPSLHTLRISKHHRVTADAWDHSGFDQSLVRYAPTLRELSMDGITIKEDEIIRMIGSLSSLVVLSLRNVSVGLSLLGGLAGRTSTKADSRSTLVPQLEELEVDTDTLISDTAVFELVESRRSQEDQHSRLKRVTIGQIIAPDCDAVHAWCEGIRKCHGVSVNLKRVLHRHAGFQTGCKTCDRETALDARGALRTILGERKLRVTPSLFGQVLATVSLMAFVSWIGRFAGLFGPPCAQETRRGEERDQ